MKLASIFICDPCTSWKPRDRHEYSYNFSCSEVFAEEVCIKEDMTLVSKEVECLGGALVDLLKKLEEVLNIQKVGRVIKHTA